MENMVILYIPELIKEYIKITIIQVQIIIPIKQAIQGIVIMQVIQQATPFYIMI